MKFKTSQFYLRSLISLIIINLISCGPKIGQVVISRPDEYRHTYEAREKVILYAVARIFKDKNMGSNVLIDPEKRQVETDYIIQGDWRTRSTAKIRKLNWKECEVVLVVITEKKTETGWEMRRLLDKDQYINLFDTIDLMIYEEMSRTE
jgi:bifunctional DNA-binding transcriptional regulator/antitoxin component of YhaV-PrlF toxin-antitoxin module